MDRVELACRFTVAKSQAAVRAGLGAAEKLLRSLTGLNIGIIIQLFRVIRRAVAHDVGDLFFHAVRALAEDGGELFGAGGTADRALGAGDAVRIICQRVRVVVTAGIAAAAAVRAGQLRTEFQIGLIFLNIEDLRCVRKDDGSDQSYGKDQENRY